MDTPPLGLEGNSLSMTIDHQDRLSSREILNWFQEKFQSALCPSAPFDPFCCLHSKEPIRAVRLKTDGLSERFKVRQRFFTLSIIEWKVWRVRSDQNLTVCTPFCLLCEFCIIFNALFVCIVWKSNEIFLHKGRVHFSAKNS